MYVAGDNEVLVERVDFPKSEPGAPLPLVTASEGLCVLAYQCRSDANFFSEEAPNVITSFAGAFYFGEPNDEALLGHPLYGKGLRIYSVFEVRNSSWVRLMETRNRVYPRHQPERFAQLKHFIFTFHDSIFECVTRELQWDIWTGNSEALIAEMARRLGHSFYR